MKAETFKKFIKQAVKEAIQEELKDILLEAVKSNKQPLQEFDQSRSLPPTKGTGNVQSLKDKYLATVDHDTPVSPIDAKKKYMEILNETAKGPVSGFDGEFQLVGSTDTISEGSALPQGQLPIDKIMGLIKG